MWVITENSCLPSVVTITFTKDESFVFMIAKITWWAFHKQTFFSTQYDLCVLHGFRVGVTLQRRTLAQKAHTPAVHKSSGQRALWGSGSSYTRDPEKVPHFTPWLTSDFKLHKTSSAESHKVIQCLVLSLTSAYKSITVTDDYKVYKWSAFFISLLSKYFTFEGSHVESCDLLWFRA